MREGRHLLSNLEAAKAAKADGQEDKDIKQDWDTVQRYSTLLKKRWFRQLCFFFLVCLVSFISCCLCGSCHGMGFWRSYRFDKVFDL